MSGNQNGHLGITTVAQNGAATANLWLPKGASIAVPSPFEIVSPDGSKTTTISVSNAGNTIIDSEMDLSFYNNDGTVIFQAPDGTPFKIAMLNGGDAIFTTASAASLNIASDGITTIGPGPESEATGNGALRIRNGNNCTPPANFVTYVGGNTAGSLTVGNLQTYGYIDSNISKVLDMDPLGESCIVGSVNTIGGAVLEVDGTLGTSRVLDPKYNPPSYVLQASLSTPVTSPLFVNKTVSTINLAGNTKFVLYFSDFSYSTTTASGPATIYKWFIADELDGQQENAVAPLKFIVDSTDVDGVIKNYGTQIFIYNSATPRNTLYLNVVQENQAEAGQINDFTALVTIVASK